MSTLAGHVALHRLVLPGSHDSCAYTVHDRLARTQDASLDAQLAHGVRVFDIRCRHECDVFHINHGAIALGLMFDDVVKACGLFLAQHPGETIVMSVKDECGSRACTRSFAQTFAYYVARHAHVRWLLAQRIPTLDEARGAIVLLRRFASPCEVGIDLTAWPENATFAIEGPTVRFAVQDEFRVPVRASIDYKWQAIQALLEKTPSLPETCWPLNFCSGTGMGANPRLVASGDAQTVGIHARLAAWLAERGAVRCSVRQPAGGLPTAQARPIGTLMLDFCDWRDWSLVRALIANNMQQFAARA
jgi:1-phosphatidylinositol phosphodiesterase